jgi:site-specific recombinase XerD
MIEEMRLRNFSPRTEQSYVAAMVGLAKHYHRSPDQLTQDEIRSYLLHLKERGLSPSSRNVAISGMKFFYHQILGWDEHKLFLPPRKGSWRLPEVLSPKEVERLLCANGKLRDRCLLMTAYATGVRVSELGRLKVSDIDSNPVPDLPESRNFQTVTIAGRVFSYWRTPCRHCILRRAKKSGCWMRCCSLYRGDRKQFWEAR